MSLSVGQHSEREGPNLSVFLANAGHGGVRGLVFMINTLVLVPLLMISLGKQQFAILAIAMPFMRYGFNGVFDFGVATGVIRHTSRSFAASDTEGTNAYVSSSVATYLVFGLALISLVYLSAPWLLSLLVRSNVQLYGSARIVFERAVWVYLLFSLSNPFFAVLMGVQKVEATHWIGTASLLLELFGILLVVPFGLTLPRVMLVYGANAGLSLTLSLFLARRYFPSLRLRWRYVSMTRIKEILLYGVQFSATALVAIVSPILDKLIVARFVGLNAVAFYEAAARLVELLKRATQLSLLPLFPIAGATQDTHTESERRGLYLRAFSANLFVSCGLYLIPASLAYGIFRVWLGPESKVAALVFSALCATAFCQAVVGPLTMILLGTGKLKALIVTALLGLLVNVTLSPVLAHYLGFFGVLAGTMLAYGAISLILFVWSLRIAEFAIPTRELLRLGGSAVFAGLLPGIALTRALRLGEQPLGWLKLIVAGMISGGVFVLVSLAQTDVRRMALRVFERVRQKASFALAR